MYAIRSYYEVREFCLVSFKFLFPFGLVFRTLFADLAHRRQDIIGHVKERFDRPTQMLLGQAYFILTQRFAMG